MRIAAIAMLRDEADIVEAWARHNLHFVDALFIIDDGSTDATAEILALLKAEGLPVEVVSDGRHLSSYRQGERTTWLATAALQREAWDFIIPLDGDEFLCAQSRDILEADLAALPAGHVPGFTPLHYFPTADDDASEPDPLVRLTHVGDHAPYIFKAGVDGPTMARPGVRIADGNHLVLRHEAAVPATLLPRVSLAHFAVRSTDQLIAKLIIGRMRHCARDDFHGAFAMGVVGAANALAGEPHLIPADLTRILEVYEPHARKLKPRPFTERRGSMRYGALAVIYPYRRMISAAEGLIEGARAATAENRRLQKQLEKARQGAIVTFARKQARSLMRRLNALRRS